LVSLVSFVVCPKDKKENIKTNKITKVKALLFILINISTSLQRIIIDKSLLIQDFQVSFT